MHNPALRAVSTRDNGEKQERPSDKFDPVNDHLAEFRNHLQLAIGKEKARGDADSDRQ
jgi:hypothetical protein